MIVNSISTDQAQCAFATTIACKTHKTICESFFAVLMTRKSENSIEGESSKGVNQSLASFSSGSLSILNRTMLGSITGGDLI